MDKESIRELINKIGTDHDTIIRLDENVRNLIAEIKLFKDGLLAYDMRLRNLEESMIKLSPIPSVSHEQVVADLSEIKREIIRFKEKNDLLSGGWKAVVLIAGSFLGIISFIWTLINIISIIRFR